MFERYDNIINRQREDPLSVYRKEGQKMKQYEVVKNRGRYCLYMNNSRCYQIIKGYRKNDYLQLCDRLNKIAR